MGQIRVVTDSTSDIPVELAAQWGIEVVPCYINFGTDSYLDQVELSRPDFYAKLTGATTHPTTAAPPAGMFADVYQRLIGQADGILSIHPPDALSALRQSAINGWNLVKDAASIPYRALDAGQLSMGLGWVVVRAAQAAAAGARMDELEALVADLYRRVHLFAGLDTVEYLWRSGRVGWARGTIGRLLRIRPMLKLYQGELISLGYVRTRGGIVDRLMAELDELGELECLTVLFSNLPAIAEQLKQRLAALSLPDALMTVNVTPILGTHVGPGGVGFVAIQR